MRYDRIVDVPASAEATWQVLEDVESWPTWAPTFEEVVLAGPLAVGTPVTIKQPGRSRSHWQIQAVEPGRSFRWGSQGALVDQWADHVVEATGPDRCRVTLTFWMSGPLGELAALLAGRAIRRMVDSEGEALVRRLSR